MLQLPQHSCCTASSQSSSAQSAGSQECNAARRHQATCILQLLAVHKKCSATAEGCRSKLQLGMCSVQLCLATRSSTVQTTVFTFTYLLVRQQCQCSALSETNQLLRMTDRVADCVQQLHFSAGCLLLRKTKKGIGCTTADLSVTVAAAQVGMRLLCIYGGIRIYIIQYIQCILENRRIRTLFSI